MRGNQNQSDQFMIIQTIIPITITTRKNGFTKRMAKNFNDLPGADPKTMTRDQAMIYIINFFNSRMMTMSKNSVNKVKDLISLHEIYTSELVNKYVELVLENS
jgi:hypothetical protein